MEIGLKASSLKEILFKPILVLLCILLFGCREEILHDLSEFEAHTYISALSEVHIEASRIKQTDGRWMISVPSAKALDAIKLLKDRRLTNKQDKEKKDSRQSSILASPSEERFHFERSLSKEIERTVLDIRDVLDARVHLNLPARDPLWGKVISDDSGSGGVLITVQDGFETTSSEIGDLVAGASGIPKEKISVIINRINTTKINERILPNLDGNRSSIYGFIDRNKSAVVSSAVLLIVLVLVVGIYNLKVFKLKRSVISSFVHGDELARDGKNI